MNVSSCYEEAPWNRPNAFPATSDLGEYGYCSYGKIVGCSREELIDYCKSHWVQLVWTPDHTQMTPPAKIDFLRSEVETYLRKARVNHLINGFGVIAIAILLLVVHPRMKITHYLGIAYGVRAILLGLWTFVDEWSMKRRPLDQYASEARYDAWASFRSPKNTWMVAVCIVSVFVAQLVVGITKSFEIAGLEHLQHVSQLSRTLTSPWIHNGFLHLAVNIVSLFYIGKLVECIAGSRMTPIIFQISALVAALLSGVFMSDAAIAGGASGGICGLIGFAFVLLFIHRKTLPLSDHVNAFLNLILMFIISVAFYENIDIVAHLAGLFCGIVFALIFICLPKREKKESPTQILINNWLFALTPLPFSLYAIYVLLTS